MSREVVITGVGVMSACGRGVDALAEAIGARRTACARDEGLRAIGGRCVLAGRVPGLDEAFASLAIDAREGRFFGRFARLGAVAATDALRASGRTAVGRVIVATGVGPMGELEACFRDALRGERHPHPAHAVTRVTPSFVATYLASIAGARHGGHVVSCACSSSMVALAEAFELVRSGREEACLVGGIEEDSPYTAWAFDQQRQLTHAPTPDRRSRPLSGQVEGFFPAGGAAFFVLEEGQRARDRGQAPLARVAAVALRSDPTGASLVSWPERAYRAAVDEVMSASPGQIDLVMAHSPPTLADPDELTALADSLGPDEVPVRSFKSTFGYTLGASVALDVALSTWQLAHRRVLPNDLDAVVGRMLPFSRRLLGEAPRPPRRVLKTVYAQGFSAGAALVEGV